MRSTPFFEDDAAEATGELKDTNHSGGDSDCKYTFRRRAGEKVRYLRGNNDVDGIYYGKHYCKAAQRQA